MRPAESLGHLGILRALLLVSLCSALPSVAEGQQPASGPGELQRSSGSSTEKLSLAPAKVEVKPIARDEEIRQRLLRVLDATEWSADPQVRVEEGVVFLHGHVETEEIRKWAGDLARNTQDVVAVANRIEVAAAPVWDFRPAWAALFVLWRDFLRSLPQFAFAVLILAFSVGASVLATRGAQTFFRERIRANLLRSVVARGLGVLVFLFGLYIVLRVSGLTQLALTIVGGTVLIGLALGIAFRDITENFLASIFLSMQRPFEMGDLVEIAGVTGYVQQLNVRTTMLMALDGNLVQIPNAAVFRSHLRNFTTNSNRREDFGVGIGYEDSISDAQEIARKVLADHPAVLKDPEPSVLAESLGSSTINLRIYFWLNGREHSWLKVRSSVIRLVKSAFQENGVSMPDDAREIVFPNGVPVTLLRATKPESPGPVAPKASPAPARREEIAAVSTKAEGGLDSEAEELQQQAQRADLLKGSENLLPAAAGAPRPARTPAPPTP